MSEQVGTLAEEAAKLLAAAQDWARTRFDQGREADAPECQLCPVCRGVAALRQVKPETVQHLLSAAAEVAAAWRVTVAQPGQPAEPNPVQHIDVREG